jgi:hypothetical protein
MNLFCAAFELFRHSPHSNCASLQFFCTTPAARQYIRRNLEFSYIATSNHYLSDVVGLLWLGLLLPELRDAGEWRDLASVQMLREMDKQVLAMERISKPRPAITALSRSSSFTRSALPGEQRRD